MRGNLLAPFGITVQSLRGMDADTRRSFVESAVRNMLRFHHPDRFATEKGKEAAQERFNRLQRLWDELDPERHPEVFAEALAWYDQSPKMQLAQCEADNARLRIVAASCRRRWRGILSAYADPDPALGASLVHCAGAVFHLGDRMARAVRLLPFRASFIPDFPQSQFVVKVEEDGSLTRYSVEKVPFDGHDEPPPGLSWVYRPTQEIHMSHARGWRIGTEGMSLSNWRLAFAMQSSYINERRQAWPVSLRRLLPTSNPTRQDIVDAMETGYPFSAFEQYEEFLAPYARKFMHLVVTRRDPVTGESRFRVLGYIYNVSAPGVSPEQLGYYVGADIDPVDDSGISTEESEVIEE